MRVYPPAHAARGARRGPIYPIARAGARPRGRRAWPGRAAPQAPSRQCPYDPTVAAAAARHAEAAWPGRVAHAR